MSGRIWINGSLQESAEARISPFDHGWTVGNGVFETLIAYEGKVFAFKRHWERLQHSAAVMGLPVEAEDALREACQSVLSANGLAVGRARVRITVTGGEASLGSDRGEAPTTVVVAATAVDPPATSAEVVVVPYTRNATGALAGVKATSYGENVVALAEARRAGASEAIFANTEGFLCEGSGSNVFFVKDGVLKTPALSCGCLAGVTRALVLELADKQGFTVSEADLPLARFKEADEAFLTGTIREVQAIRAIDGEVLPSVGGPVTESLREAFVSLRERSLEP